MRLLRIAIKDLTIAFRDRAGLLLMLVAPMVLTFGMALVSGHLTESSGPILGDIPVVIVSARDPIGAPVVSSSVTVTRSGGLSTADLLSCIEAVSQVLAPPERPGPAQSRTRVV